MKHGSRGFNLIEVLVSLIIISVGLMGIAKLQVVALAESGTSSLRSIAAIEASSMAASMRANRAYWSTGASLNPARLTVRVSAATGSSIQSTTDPAMIGTPNCQTPGTPCSITAMATYDVEQWATALSSPGALGGGANYRATIDCDTTITPITCTIVIDWDERLANTAGGATVTANSALISPSYTLFVQP